MIVTGTITDKADGSPLYGANIVAVDANGAIINRASGGVLGTSSGTNGQYQLNDAPSGGRLRITYVGYTPVTVPVSSIVNVQLSQNNELPEAVVRAEKLKKNKRIWGAIGLLAIIAAIVKYN